MNIKDNTQYERKDNKKVPLEHETNKTGQRQGGIDKKGEKEKDKKSEF